MAKANFDEIYTAPDPRAYFRTLGALDYQIPAHGAAVFGALADQIAEGRGREGVRIADLCCSYGINAAVMRHDTTYPDIVDHYTSESAAHLTPEEVLERDLAFFADRRDRSAPEVVGLDVADAAVGYAIAAGFLDAGSSQDLEREDPTPTLAAMLEPTDLVTVTGGIGYITERTVERVLDAANDTPWVAALCLRWVDFDPIAQVAADRDMEVHHLSGVTFPQRRFTDPGEQEYVLDQLAEREVDPAGREEDGYHHAELFLLRPAAEPLATPLDALITSPTDDLPFLDPIEDLRAVTSAGA